MTNTQNMQSAREILLKLETSQDGCVYIVCNRIRWSFYVERSKIVYASHSLESFERLERHLRGLSQELPALKDKVRSQLRLIFDDTNPDTAKYKVTSEILCTEYLAILWLVKENYLPKPIASRLVARMVQEVVELFICLPNAHMSQKYYRHLLQDTFCSLTVTQILEVVDRRLKAWQQLGPTISSPHQSLYLVSQESAAKKLPLEAVQRLGQVLRGFNLYQLGALLRKDPLAIAKQLMPLINDGSILLRDPLAPYDQLPRTYYHNNPTPQTQISIPDVINEPEADIANISQSLHPDTSKVWKIVCIDDSESMLSIISSYLGSQDFQVTLIQDSLKALMKLNTIQPDLILLDIGMPNVDGYQLCSLIRKSSNFKEIPIVMVTGNKGLIDRARAKMVGATDYLTKPFIQSDLLKMVMRHLI